LKTKFNFWTFFIFIPVVLFSVVVMKMGIDLISDFFTANKIIVRIIVLVFFVSTLVWLLFGELRNKFILVRFSDQGISIAKLGGLLGTKSFENKDIDYWKYSKLGNYLGLDEFLYLYSNGKKIAKISEFYHKNYNEVKEYVSKRISSEGYESFNYLDELKEVFI